MMPAFVDKIVRNAKVATIADTPAGKNLFYIAETSPKLSKEPREALHSDTAKFGKKNQSGHPIAGKLSVHESTGAYRR